MDFATIGGLLLALAAIAGAEAMDHGSLRELLSPSALVLIIGGTIGVTAISYKVSDLLLLPKAILSAVLHKASGDPFTLATKIVQIADKARREGLLALEDEAGLVAHPVLRRGLVLIADGVDPKEVESSLRAQANLMEHKAHQAAGILEAAGGFAPTIGIIGTVMGLVRVLGNLDDPSKLAGAISVAFLATLYGIGTANLFWLPMAAKIRRNVQLDNTVNHMIMEGLAAVQGGWVPRMVQEKLSIYLSSADQAKLSAGKEA